VKASRVGLRNPLANYSHGSGLGSRTSSILARVCSCFVSATPLREWKDCDDVSQSELRHAFADGWEIESLEPVRLEIRPEYSSRVTGKMDSSVGFTPVAFREIAP
jgi:hypothetical protein